MEEKLKRCPFCGSHELKFFEDGVCHWIECGKCEATSGEKFTIEEAIKSWNTRLIHNVKVFLEQEKLLRDAENDLNKLQRLLGSWMRK